MYRDIILQELEIKIANTREAFSQKNYSSIAKILLIYAIPNAQHFT